MSSIEGKSREKVERPKGTAKNAAVAPRGNCPCINGIREPSPSGLVAQRFELLAHKILHVSVALSQRHIEGLPKSLFGGREISGPTKGLAAFDIGSQVLRIQFRAAGEFGGSLLKAAQPCEFHGQAVIEEHVPGTALEHGLDG